jgi:hypothetical protein
MIELFRQESGLRRPTVVYCSEFRSLAWSGFTLFKTGIVPVMTVEGVPVCVRTGGGIGGAFAGAGAENSLASKGGMGSIEDWCAISALRAATIGCKPATCLELGTVGALLEAWTGWTRAPIPL